VEETVPMVCRDARSGLNEARLSSPAGMAKRGRSDMLLDGDGGLAGFAEFLAPPSDGPPKA